jgi:hypothetical protein
MKISLCADDYSIAPGVSAAIRELAEAGRISASGAMTVWPEWPREGAMIRGWPCKTEWGLHLTLTDAHPLGPMPRLAPEGRLPPLSRLLYRAVTVGLPSAEVRDEIARQLDAFESVTGRSPSFVDGHQHVHVLPGVREAVLALFGPRLDPERTWLRVCTSAPQAILRRGVARRRALLIDRLSRPLGRQARQLGILVNEDFRGVTEFRPEDVAAEFDAWLDGAGPGTLVMCHPGRVDDTLRRRDPVLARREAERDFLGGAGFDAALARNGLSIAPLIG